MGVEVPSTVTERDKWNWGRHFRGEAAEGHAGGTTNSFRTHGMWPTGSTAMVGVLQRVRVPRTTGPKNVKF